MTLSLHFIDENGNRYELLNDFMGYARINEGEYILRSIAFPDIKSVNWDAGYVVMKNGTIVCSLEANWFIASYDGCRESEICLRQD